MQSYDDRLTFLLPRPLWVNDLDVVYCTSCNAPFGTLKRRHHCRNCGNIFCHECSARKVPLPQLGYGTKPVRVCSGCFDVSYLVTYATDEDHGLSTQIHGVRGLLELAEKDNEKDLHNMVAYGGVDALIWLCRSSKNIQLHHLATTILAMLTEKESIRPVIITKWALPPLLYLIRHYTQVEQQQQYQKNQEEDERTTTSSSSYSELSLDTKQSIQLEIIINCTHILYQLSKAGILSQKKEVIDDGVFDVMLHLANFDLSDENQHQLMERISIIQTLAAKTISSISSLVSLQPNIIELVQNTNKLAHLLGSSNQEVCKYIAKTVAFLSLRNDKYKAILLEGDGSRALVSIIALLPQTDDSNRLKTLSYYLARSVTDISTVEKTNNAVAVSHVCCAMANFATNNESQLSLMSQPHLLQYICNVPAVFTTHIEIHKHVARCLANLSLYKENGVKMLSKSEEDSYNILPTLMLIGNQPNVTVDIQRQIIRAIDNLSSNVPVVTEGPSYWRALFGDLLEFIDTILNKEGQDTDIVKRATNILERAKTESKESMVIEEKITNHHVEQEQEEDQNDRKQVEDNVNKEVVESTDSISNTEEEHSVKDDDEAKPESSPELTIQKDQDDEVETMAHMMETTTLTVQQSDQDEKDDQESSNHDENHDQEPSNQDEHLSHKDEKDHQDEQQQEQPDNDQIVEEKPVNEVEMKDNTTSDDLLETQTDDSKKTQPTTGTNKPKNKKKNRKHK
ncbi:hypothetical protein K501DRAFT_334324 [Backusella circina FSU 941]|nr:hypothetical protein K501DRAFT_334324 [Backusella circina FSU 941]